ncbi:DEBR0S3_15170g1_1 [Brettanomyces bruxellensis]|uniref:DEBR0S3_15170g1_1 n=1 Tax=Dekkera bruxellensis TaxID=5007 RepID=A0A7D9H508_DEKBR|nr:DEBR0S3_15170g1_1 [Brettanomyces bruxellensis]
MGNDGGTIPSRKEILNFTQRKLGGVLAKSDVSKKERELWKLAGAFGYCQLSHKRLSKPIVSDYMGRLFNKEDVILYLIAKRKRKKARKSKKSKELKDGSDEKKRHNAKEDTSEDSDPFPHLRTMKDLVELNIEYNEHDGTVKCPLSGKVFHLRSEKDNDINQLQLCYLVPCGCTVGKEILDQYLDVEYKKAHVSANKRKSRCYVKMRCPVCGSVTCGGDIVDINTRDDTEKERLAERMRDLEDSGLTHSLKPQRKASDGHTKRKGDPKDNIKKDAKKQKLI